MIQFIAIMAIGLFVTPVYAEQPTPLLKPNARYVHLYDVDLASETVDSKENKDGIAFYTTDSTDSYEGPGMLHLSTKGMFFNQDKELLCSWQEGKLTGCPKDMPLVVERQENGRLSIFVPVEAFILKGPLFHFRDKEFLLLRGYLNEDQQKRWELLHTDVMGAIVPADSNK